MRSETWDDGRLVELVENFGDGTGQRTTYAADGTVATTEALTGLPVPVPPPPDAVGPLNALAEAQSLEEVRQAAADLRDALTARGVI